MISLSKMLDRPIARDGRKFDVSLLWMVVLMTTFSLVMIYSASIAYAASDGGSQFSFVSKQAMFILFTVAMCLPLFLLKMSFLAADYSVLFCRFRFAVVAGIVSAVRLTARRAGFISDRSTCNRLNFSNWRRSCICPACLRAVKKCCAIWILWVGRLCLPVLAIWCAALLKVKAWVRVKETLP